MKIYKRTYTFKDNLKSFWDCIFPSNKWKYLGYTFWSDPLEYSYLEEFFKEVDKVARPKWCPKILLRFTHWLGNDNSIVRVRYRWIHNLHHKITGHIMITDLKRKYDTFRIYGYFTKELYEIADKTCLTIENLE